MKRITLLVPDKIKHVSGGSRGTNTEIIEVDPDNIVEALETNDYHINYYFQPGSVVVEKIENL